MMPALLALPEWDDGEIAHELLLRCQAGDRTALRAFVDCYQRAVFALLSRIVGRNSDLEDLAQETFLRAIRALPAFDLDGPARLSTWLLTIAARLAVDACRKRTREQRSTFVAEPADASNPEHEVQRSQLRDAIALAIDELPSNQRAAFVLAEFHGFSIEEIATALQARKSTVKTRLFRARAKLSQALAHHRGQVE